MTIVIDAIRLPEDVERGAVGGPLFRTTVLDGDAGRVVTNQNWSLARSVWRITYGYMEPEDFQVIVAFFRARRGRGRGFLFKDWTDFVMTRNVIGTADSVATDFPIYKLYDDDVNPDLRRIFRPIESTIQVWVNNVPDLSGWSLVAPGIISFAVAPTTGDIEVACEFDLPVMFGSDQLNLTVAWQGAAAINELQIVELRE